VITLEVTPEEAEKVALATSQGRIQLALRGYRDSAEVFTKGAVVPDLFASYRLGAPVRRAQAYRAPSPKAAARPAVPAAPYAYSVWTLNGNASQQTKIK